MKRPRRSLSAWPFLLFPLICASLTLHLIAARAATQQPSAEIQQPIQSASDLVVVDVSVLDQKGDFYSGLTRRDFRVLDNGAEKPVLFFAPIEAPAHVVILVETGPAVYLIHEQHILALSSLLEGLAPDDEAALFTYAEKARQIQPFTADKSVLRGAIGEAQYTVGMDQLNFYDSLRAVLDWLPGGQEKKTIVALTTGLDSSTQSHWDALERKLRGNDVVIFPVELGASLRSNAPAKTGKNQKKKSSQSTAAGDSSDAFARADQALRSLAQITGGKLYFPQSPEDFAPAYREIAAAVRHQYVLGITPDRDGGFHKLSVEILNNSPSRSKRSPKTPAFRALYREGYLAPAP
jgi:VWFA-related protein